MAERSNIDHGQFKKNGFYQLLRAGLVDRWEVLDEFGEEIHVVAHTPVKSIEARYDGRLLAVDLEKPATEMLLLVWDSGGGPYQRWRFSLDAPPERF